MPEEPLAGMAEHLPVEIGSQLVGHTVEEIERELVLQTLASHGGNRTCAARALGFSIRTLRNRIKEYAAQGVDVPAPGCNR